MKYLILTMRTPRFDPQVIADHYRFLDGLRQASVLEQAGPFADKSGGAYVLQAGSYDEARQLAEQDPLCLHGCSTITVREWNAV